MKLLLDEQLSPAIARALREKGHDVVAVKERADWIQLSDDELLAVAAGDGRAIVTNNVRDYRPRAAALVTAGSGHLGLVYVPAAFRRTRRDTGRIVKALERILEAHPSADGLRDRESWLA